MLTVAFRSVFLAISFCCAILHAQTGEFLVTHYKPPFESIDHVNFDIVQDNNGLLCVANRSGILLFDGQRWEFIETPSTAFALAVDESNKLYIGCHNGFGTLSTNAEGDLEYSSLSEGLDATDIFQIVVLQNRVFFLSKTKLHVLSTNDQKLLKTYHTGESERFSLMIQVGNKILIQDENARIYSLGEEKLAPLSLKDPFDELIQFSAAHATHDGSVVGTESDRLFLFSGDHFSEIIDENDTILAGSQVRDGVWLSDTLLAISTQKNGCLFYNPRNGSFVKAVNYHTGLPDNEIYAITSDKDMGIWLAHEYGFSRTAPTLPIRSYAHYPGLEGNITDVEVYNEQLFVTTSMGVFHLKEVKNYKESVYYVKKIRSEDPEIQVTKNREAEVEDKKEKRRRGLFGFLKKKTEEDQEFRDDEEEDQEKKPDDKDGSFFKRIIKGLFKSGDPSDKTEYVRKIRRELQSTQFLYKKVPGVEAKCRRILPFRDRLLISSNNGIYELNHPDSSATMIMESPVSYLFHLREHGRVLVATFEAGVKILHLEGDVWTEQDIPVDFGSYIQQIQSGAKGRTWLTSAETVYSVQGLDGDSITVQSHPIENTHFNQVFALPLDDKMYFINSTGFYYYEPSWNKLINDLELYDKFKPIEKYFYDEAGLVWIYNGKDWKKLGNVDIKEKQIEYLSFFPQISHLKYVKEDRDIWILEGNHQIYRFDLQQVTPYYPNHNLFLRSVKDRNGLPLNSSDLSLVQDESHIVFEFTQPDFLGFSDISYQYKLIGLNKEWSKWSKANTISFHYLPPGKYTLMVRTKNAFDQFQESEPFQFSVVPPFWQQWWFYLAEIGFFGTLLLVSIRLNRAKHRYSLLSRVLTFMTLILLLEFIETTVESNLAIESSPVIDFFIEAMIAISILPVEKILRNFLQKGQIEAPGKHKLELKETPD